MRTTVDSADIGLIERRFFLAVLALAQLLLNGLHLLVQVIFALGLLHLALDSAADAFLDLHHADFALHVGVDLFQPRADRGNLEQFLLFRDLQVEVRSHRIGQLARLVDLVDRHQHFWRNLAVQLEILLELRNRRAHERFDFLVVFALFLHDLGPGLEEGIVIGVAQDLGALAAFDQHLYRAVGQFEQLQHRADRSDGKDVGGRRIVLSGVLLGDEQDLLVVPHDVFERPDGFFPPDEERHDHMRKNDNIAKRQYRQQHTALKFEHMFHPNR